MRNPDSRPLVLLASNTAWSVRKFRSRLIAVLEEAGFRVVVAAPRDEAAAAFGSSFIPIELNRKGTNPLADWLLLRRLVRLYRRRKPAIALHFTSKLNIYGALAARRAGIPTIGNITGLGSAFLGGGMVAVVQRVLYRRALRFPRLVFFQNPDDRALFVDNHLVDLQRTQLLPGSGVDLREFRPRAARRGSRFRFLLIARLLRDKGIFEYVEAARLARARGLAGEFQLLGFLDEHNPSAVAREQLEAWIGAGDIAYLGSCDDVRPALAACDCVVLPSYREGTPRSLLEAAAMAKPIITTDTPGCRQVVEDGRNGLLCRPRDSRDLAEKMQRMARLPATERRRMGQEGRRKMEREFDDRFVGEAYLQAMKRILG